MPVDNFGRSFDALPTMEELLSPVKENKKEDEKRHEELADVLRSMSDKFEKGMDQLKKVTQNLFDLTQKNDKKEFAQNRNLNNQFQRLANDINDNNRQTAEAPQLQFQRRGTGGGRPTPANRPATPPARGRNGDRGGGGVGGNIVEGIKNLIKLPDRMGKFVSSYTTLLEPPDKLYQPLGQMLDFSGSFKQLNQFDISMKRILYQTHGLTADSTEVVEAFTQLRDVSKETGFDQSKLAGIMETYARKGMRTNTNLVKHALTMQKIGRAQLFTERQLGLEAGTLTDHFSDLNIQANMSSSEIGTIAKSMRDVALNTGMTGKAMTEAIAGSKQFSNNLMNAGNLTASSLKNVTQMTANFKKFGADRAGEQIQSYLTDSNKLLLEGGDKMAMLVRQAADIGGVSQELLDGTITKSDKSMKKFSQGFKKMLNNIGVDSIEQFESLSDSVKAEINRNSQLMYGVSIGELLRADKALQESGKSFADRMKDISKEEEGMGKKTAKERADLDKRKAEMKISRSVDILGAISKNAKGADVKSMGDVFGKFGSITKEFDQDIAAILGVDAEKLKGIKGADITNDLLRKQIMNLNEQLIAAGAKEEDLVKIDQTQLDEALKEGADPTKFREIEERLQEAQRQLTTKRLEEQEPSTKALFDIQKNVDDLKSFFLKEKLQPGKDKMMERKKDPAGNEIPNSSTVDNIVDAASKLAAESLKISSRAAGVFMPGIEIKDDDLSRYAPDFYASAGRGAKGGAQLLFDALDTFFGGGGDNDRDGASSGGGGMFGAEYGENRNWAGWAGDWLSTIGGVGSDLVAPNYGLLQGGLGTQEGTWSHWLAGTTERAGMAAANFSPLGLGAKALGLLPKLGMAGRAAIGAGVGVAGGAGSGLLDWMFGGSSAATPETPPASGLTPEVQSSRSGGSTDYESELNRILQEYTANQPSMQFSRSLNNSMRNPNTISPDGMTTLLGTIDPNMRGPTTTNLLATMNPNMNGSELMMPLIHRTMTRMDSSNSAMDSSLFATNPRTQAQISNATSDRGQVFDYEERNSAEILKTLRQIRDDLKESKGSSSEDFSSSKFTLENRGGTKVDSKLGAINGGDYTSNDGIKAINY
jgi:hypothetical protein